MKVVWYFCFIQTSMIYLFFIRFDLLHQNVRFVKTLDTFSTNIVFPLLLFIIFAWNVKAYLLEKIR